MAASKGKPFQFKHVWALLRDLDKWKLRDQESAPKKADMLKDDSEDEGRKLEREDGRDSEGKGEIDDEDIGDKAPYHGEEERGKASTS